MRAMGGSRCSTVFGMWVRRHRARNMAMLRNVAVSLLTGPDRVVPSKPSAGCFMRRSPDCSTLLGSRDGC